MTLILPLNGIATLALTDVGRSNVSMIADRFLAGQAAEKLIDMTTQRGFAARSGTVTNYTVTTGKTNRIQTVWAQMTGAVGNTTAALGILRLRVNSGGPAIITSPIARQWMVTGTNGGTVGSAASPLVIPIPGALEVPSGHGMAWTFEIPGWVDTTSDPFVSFDITAFEYSYPVTG